MLTLTNPIFQNIKNAFNVYDVADRLSVAGGGVAGYGFGKLGKAGLATLLSMTGAGRFVPAQAAAFVAGIGSVAGARFLADTLQEYGLLSEQQADAAKIGGWVEALSPLYGFLVSMLPDSYVKTALLSGPNTYMVPMGAAYGVRLGDYAPGDFGDDASPNFPALAGEAPQFDGVPSGYNHEVLGENEPIWSAGY